MKNARAQSAVLRCRPRRGGFALLITITLLAFLVLLLVSLASLTRVETRVAGNNQQLAQARQNALMALSLALGQLQKHTGPDQRVTTPADIQIPTGITINATTTGNQARASLDTYWRASRNRRWTGAWRNINTTAYNSDDAPAFNPTPGLQSWLVSGNENTSAATSATPAPNFPFKPTDVVTGLTAASTPLDEIMDAGNRPHRLLVKTSAGVTDAASLDRAVTAPQMLIQSTTVPGTNGTATPVGHYAWWVGDEGVKARANLIDPYAGDPSAGFKSRQSAQRPALEAMTTNGTDGLAGAFAANDARFTRVNTSAQLGFIGSGATHQTEVTARFHDLTVNSRGVLADVKNGGLKRDISYILSRPDLSAFRTALTTVSTGSPAYNVAPSAVSNTVFSSAATPYATYPTNSALYGGNPGIFTYGPTWEQLWSFYNMGNLTSASPAGVFDTAGNANGRLQTATRQGLYPILIQAKAFYRLRIVGSQIWIDVIPMAVLANPYNVPLSGNFILRLTGYAPQVQEGTPADPDNPSTSEFTNLGSTSANAGLYNVRLVIQAVGIPPGRAQVFMVDATQSVAEVTATSTTDPRRVRMVNDYDPSTYVTINTGKTLPAGKHIALYSGSGLTGALYADDTSLGDPFVFTNLISTIATVRPSDSGMETSGFLVYPLASGTRQGGGTAFAYFDPQFPRLQQSLFYQVNYRAIRLDSHGAAADNRHPLQWARSYVYYGNTSTDDSLPNPFLAANLLAPQDSGLPTTTRWGLVNNGEGTYFTTAPASIGGDSGTTGFVNLLYDVPQPGRPITSLAQLQHFNGAGHHKANYNAGGDDRWSSMTHQFQVNYPVGNSYPNPRVRRDRSLDWQSPYAYVYDGSYLWNDLLWDRFHFSSYPQSGAFDFSTESLVNARYRPFRDNTAGAWNDPSAYRGLYLAAQNLLVEGAFNINSTSVEAWKAVFSSLRNVTTGTETKTDSGPANPNLTAPFSRILSPSGGATDAKTGISANAWNGFRNLTQDEVNTLAEEMVLQVRRRGPFLSMGEFINRRLTAGPTSATVDPFGLGLSGALQAAIDKVTNRASDVPVAPFNTQTEWSTPHGTMFPDADYRMTTRIAGHPGYLLQSDVLSPLGPSLAARSDTFTIRTYGDVVNPATSVVESRAWCEAIVQRTPDYVIPRSSGGNAPDEAATGANLDFGRRYQIVSFRWLSPEDI
ncbi:MAG TPA: hypothetical protein VK985_13250 [Rariglobus sp.]|nr:hypothetical protein [Rariglobus sp.]